MNYNKKREVKEKVTVIGEFDKGPLGGYGFTWEMVKKVHIKDINDPDYCQLRLRGKREHTLHLSRNALKGLVEFLNSDSEENGED